MKARKDILEGQHRSFNRFRDLVDSFRASRQSAAAIQYEIYPVRAIALLELFTRSWARQLVDGSRTFGERALPLLQSMKPDYVFFLEIAEKKLSLGDVVAHVIPFSSVDHVMTTFQKLSEKKMQDELASVVDRWSTEVLGNIEKPVLSEVGATLRRVANVFTLRHKIAHEAYELSLSDKEELDSDLQAIADLANALDWYLISELYGKIPLTQTDMNLGAMSKAAEANERMADVMKELEHLLQNQPRATKLLQTTQHAWKRYCTLQQFCAQDPENGGTIGPLIWAGEAQSLTEERISRLKQHIAFSGLLSLP